MTKDDDSYICAVYANKLCKSYLNSEPVLHNFCMNVEKGTIYGLLGASGCGKTTFISCIVGLKKWDSGNLLLFGQKPGPGRNVGYMPQDLSLHNYLSAKETVQFYGKLYNLEKSKVTERLNNLTQLLQLSSTSQRVGDLSGGQKRRVSLALALLRSPDLLVLDEPTVGLDPLLRVKIWDYLYKLVKTLGITVILTTHYTEEVRHADTIGVMRKGRLILEDNPDNFLRQYNCQFLEQAVLELCRNDKKDEITKQKRDYNDYKFKTGFFLKVDEFDSKFNGDLRITINKEIPVMNNHKIGTNTLNFQNTRALTKLNLVRYIRTPLILLPTLFSIAMSFVLSILMLGTKPVDLGFGIVNYEISDWAADCNFPTQWTNSCDLTFLSCKYLDHLKITNLLELRQYENETAALADAHLGLIRGFVTFPANYSQHMLDLGLNKQFSGNETLQGSNIYTRLDYSDYIASYYMITHLLNSYQEYAKHIATSCGISEDEAQIPLKFDAIENGYQDDSFTNFMLPGAILCSILSLTSVLTGTEIVSDRKQGTFSRAVVAGMSFTDIVLSNLITQFIFNVIQTLSVAGLVYFVFFSPNIRSSWISLIICVLLGQCATCLGIFLGVFFSEEVDIVVLGTFTLVVTLLYGGVVWPSECMAKTWRYLGYLLPASFPTQSLRYMVHRGLEITHPLVWPGFAAIFIWSSLLLIGSFICYKRLHK